MSSRKSKYKQDKMNNNLIIGTPLCRIHVKAPRKQKQKQVYSSQKIRCKSSL